MKRNKVRNNAGTKEKEYSGAGTTPERLRILQLTELEMLIELDRICRKNHIKYTIIGGTLLGAVRHKGFVPWDDDADVAMLREDYDRFLDVCKTDLDQTRFYVHDRFQTEGYRWGFGKMRRRDTAYVRLHQEDMPYEQGVWIDIMPLDYIPNSKIGQWLCNLASVFFRKAAYAKVGKKVEKNPVYRTLYKFLDIIPLEIQNREYLKFIKRLNRKPTHYLRCLGVRLKTSRGHKGYWRYKAKWMEHLIDYDFEGYPLLGMKDGKMALERMYGNYMEPVQYPFVEISSCKLLPVEKIQVREKLKQEMQNLYMSK